MRRKKIRYLSAPEAKLVKWKMTEDDHKTFFFNKMCPVFNPKWCAKYQVSSSSGC